MSKARSFFKRALIGGLLVMLPTAILAFFFRWLFRLVTDLLAPVSNQLISRYDLPQLTADILTLAIIITLCFVVGTLVSTRMGRWAHNFFEQRLERFTPGYRMIKEIVNQFLGEKESSPFSKGQVALAPILKPASPHWSPVNIKMANTRSLYPLALTPPPV